MAVPARRYGPVMNVTAALDAAYDRALPVFAGVRPDQLDAPTPCAAWDVRALVEHAVGVVEQIAAAVTGTAPPELTAVADDPGAAFEAAADRSRAAWATPGVLDRSFTMPWGESTGDRTASMNLVDVLVHAWDLAHATGQSIELPDEPCEVGLAFVHQMLQPQYRSDAPDATFGPERTVADDAPAGDRLLAFLGRQP